MKNIFQINNRSIALTLFLCLSFLSFDLNAQWAGSSTTNGNIYRSGFVGIGSSMTSPNYQLDISTLSGTKAAIRVNTVDSNNGKFKSGLAIGVADTDDRFSQIAEQYDVVFSARNQNPAVPGGTISNYNNMIISNQTMGDLIFTTKFNTGPETARMRLLSNGKLVIGEELTACGDYRLYVERGILTEEVKVAIKDSNEWCDYVFAKDYKLPSLTEVETHINQFQHLPNVPSAKTLADDGGIKLKEMTISQQEKIEELFLYMIEMNKKVEALEQENAILKSKVK